MSDRDDLIKREDAIDEIRKSIIPHDMACTYYSYLCINAVRRVPSADRPQGYWIKTDVATYRCSECGKKQIADDENELNYCCCCGSRNNVRRLKGASDNTDRPQGEWIHNPNGIDRDFIWWKCSKCGHVIYSESEHDREEFHAFCGRCGARMKGADDE